MKKHKTFLSIIVMTILSSCIYNDTAITEDLGSQYFYLGAGNESQILLGNEKTNAGITIVPQEVVEYNFDSRYIIAKSIMNIDNVTKQTFWIVDKKDKNSPLLLDSISFTKKVEELNLKLKLKLRK